MFQTGRLGLEFELLVTDTDGNTDTDTVDVLIVSDVPPSKQVTTSDGFTLDGEENPESFTTSGDTLSASITASNVDFADLNKLEVELKGKGKNKIEVNDISLFDISGNTASVVVSGLSSTFDSGDLVSFKIKAEDNSKNKVEYKLQIVIG